MVGERRRVLGGLLLAGLLLAGVSAASLLMPDRRPASIDLAVSQAELPAPEALVQSGWTACTATHAGVAVEVAGNSYPRRVNRSAVVVRGGEGLWLIATPPGDGLGARRQRLASSELTTDAAKIPSVPMEWLALLPVMPAPPDGAAASSAALPATPDAAVGGLCVELDTAHGRGPRVWLVDSTGDVSLPPPGERQIAVEPGRGALVMTGTWASVVDTAPMLLDSFGSLHRLPDEPAALARIGYPTAALPAVPQSWLDLFADGLALSPTS